MPDPKLERYHNSTYYVFWTVGRRTKRVSTRTKDLATATDFFKRWQILEKSRKTANTAEIVTIDGLWSVYRTQHVETKTVIGKQLDSVWRRVGSHFGKLTPADITQTVVDQYERRRRAGTIGRPAVSGSIRKELNALLACLNWCAHPRRKLIAKADLPDFDLPDPSAPRDRWLQIPELQRLLAAARELRGAEKHLSVGERFLWLALETGARKTAICELTWDRVDFETGVIHYNVPGARVSKKRRASAPMSSALRPILERAYKEKTDDYVLGKVRRDVWYVVKAIAARAGVARVSPHVLRHTAATLMARKGVPVAHIADLLGNTIAMTEKTYRKHCPDATRRAVEHISGGLLAAAE